MASKSRWRERIEDAAVGFAAGVVAVVVGIALMALWWPGPANGQDIPPEFLSAPEQLDSRDALMMEALAEAMRTVSDSEYAGCLGEPKHVQRCESDVPQWKRLTGVVVVKLPQ